MRNLTVLVLLALIIIISPFIGVFQIDTALMFDSESLSGRIFYELRLPRMILAFFTGATLALTGLLFQSLFRNALMTPFTLGISSGAVLGAGIAIKLGITTLFLGISAITLFGITGALLTVFLILWLAQYLYKAEHESLLLLGIALSFFYTSALTVIFYLSSAVQSHDILRFTMGSLSVVGYASAITTSLIAIIVLFVIYRFRFALHIMAIGDLHAKQKGINTQSVTYLLLGISSVGVGIVVSLVGPIGFVGLVIPHIVRKIYKNSLVHLIVPSFMVGGVFLLACDTLARALSYGSEIPIGVITAFIGAPFFIYLIVKKS